MTRRINCPNGRSRRLRLAAPLEVLHQSSSVAECITVETSSARGEVIAKSARTMLTPDPGDMCSLDNDRRKHVAHAIVKAGLPLLAALAAGCTTMGTGFGSTPTGANPVTFSWKSSDAVSGTMNAMLSDGKTYSGQFFQITKDTTVDSVGPLWGGWGGWGGWNGWGGRWGGSPTPDFIKNYTGKVVANLGAPGGEHMRCQFQLAHPANGMAGGGSGQCQTPDGKTIDATFPSA